MLNYLDMWQKIDNSLYRKFEFKNFDEAFEFIQKVAKIAQDLNHHPKITNTYNDVELELSTHSAGNIVTEKDEQLARAIDKLFAEKPKDNGKFTLERAKLFTDGGSRGNPGPSALGYVIYDKGDSLIEKNSHYLGIITNNKAEYLGLKEGLEAAKILGVKKIEVYMDSELIVKQMQGLYKVKNAELQPINAAVKQLCSEFDFVSFTHIPREQNTVADAMVNECLDAAVAAGL